MSDQDKNQTIDVQFETDNPNNQNRQQNPQPPQRDINDILWMILRIVVFVPIIFAALLLTLLIFILGGLILLPKLIQIYRRDGSAPFRARYHVFRNQVKTYRHRRKRK